MTIDIQNEDYKIIKAIGKGGMSTVYLSIDRSLARDVAIKVLHSNLSSDPKNRERLRREALAIAKMNHDNIVKIYKFVEEEEHSYIVMEYVDGSDLEGFIQEHPIHYVEIALAIFLKISRAISHAHQKGIIHRDIKPENVMVSKKGDIKVMDFGISSILGEFNNLTTTGSIMGSPMFMSPEHLSDDIIDHQSDIFSLGIVLYSLLTRDYPFKGKNTGQLLRNIASCTFPNAQQKNKLIPNRINKIIEKCLTKDKEDRYKSLNKVVDDIETYFKKLKINPDTELIAFFENPERYQTEFANRIIDIYIGRGRLALSEKSYSTAIEYANLVLEYSASNSDAFAIIRTVEKNKLIKKVIPISIVIILIMIGFIYMLSSIDLDNIFSKKKDIIKVVKNPKEINKNSIYKNTSSDTKSVLDNKIKLIENDKKDIESIKTEKKIVKTNKLILKKNKKINTLNKHIKKAVVKKNFLKPIRIVPKAASVYLNGKHYGYGDLKFLKLKTNKKYNLSIKSIGCEEKKLKLFFKKENKMPLAIRLKWKNARLNISNQHQYDIYIDNKYHGNFKTIEYFKRPDIKSDGKMSITLKSKDKNGKIIFEEKINLIAGKIISKVIK